jgi:uncharacterized Ntn-hydrolase superfamily protein
VTFSLVARSADARLFGMAICSSSPAVAARCAHARAGVGVVATQNITDPSLGAKILDALAGGAGATGATGATAGDARAALATVLAATPHGAYRQVLVIGSAGAPAVHSGVHALGVVGAATGAHAAAAGNLLASSEVPRAMLDAFEGASGHFGLRLLRALRAGADAGGEAGPVHSAGLLIVRDVPWPLVDLRVDWVATDPVAALTAIWDIYSPQIEDYVCRAIDPSRAPGFGVPGDPAG